MRQRKSLLNTRNPQSTTGGLSLGPDIVFDQDPLDDHRATPERSLDQRMDALSTANEVRTLRAQLKRDLNIDENGWVLAGGERPRWEAGDGARGGVRGT